MKKRVVIVCLTLVLLAGAMAAAGLPLESRAAAATPAPAVTPAVTPELPPETPPAPEAAEPLAGLGGILERLAQDFDPASGAVGAYRWAESILGQYLADGRDTASARAAGAAYAATERVPSRTKRHSLRPRRVGHHPQSGRLAAK